MKNLAVMPCVIAALAFTVADGISADSKDIPKSSAIEPTLVVVSGGVRAPGSMQWQENLTVASAILHCGGVTSERYVSGVIVRETIRVRLYVQRILDGSVADPKLRPGDRLELTEWGIYGTPGEGRIRVEMNARFVGARLGTYWLQPGTTVSTLLETALPAKIGEKKWGVLVLRTESDAERPYPYDFSIGSPKAAAFVLLDGDEIRKAGY